MEKENLTTQQWDWIGEHPARALSPEVQARIFSRESHVANPATCVLSSKSTGKKIIALSTAFVFLWSMCITPVMAETINLQGGSVEVNVQDNTTNWNVTGNPVWNMPEFNVAQGSIYNIAGLGAGASLALLVNGGSASNIFGTMNLSNIAFILQNIAGINIGSSAMINLSNASLIASTLPLNLSMTDFLKENYQFSGQGGFLSNEGHILGGKGDLVALIANAIENKGTIEVPMGTVALAAGKTVTVGISGDGLVSIGVDEATANALGLKDQIKNTGTIQANGGHVILNAKAVDGLFEKAINIAKGSNSVAAVIADDGKIEFVAQGDVTNTGTLQAKRGKIEIKTDGVIENRGTIDAKIFQEHGYTFRSMGILKGGDAYFDNTDGAADISGSLGSAVSDTGNINVVGDLTLTQDITITADSDSDGVGSFLMGQGYTLTGAGFSLILKASGASTIGKVTGVKDVSLNAQTSGATYQVRNAVTMSGDLRINSGVILTGGYSVTVGGGDVTGDGVINMSGGTFKVIGAGTFGGSYAWTFDSLSFGDGVASAVTEKTGSNKITVLTELKINNNHELKAGVGPHASYWNLSWGGGKLTDVLQMVGGFAHTLALLSDGTVRAWGDNTYGQLGDGTYSFSLTPEKVRDESGTGYLSGVSQVAAGGYHSMALFKEDGSVVAWGKNDRGQLGNGDDGGNSVAIPTKVVTPDGDGVLVGVSQISAGGSHSLALKDGNVLAWGDNTYGQLGNGWSGADEFSSVPLEVLSAGEGSDSLSGISQVSAGGYHSLALLEADGSVLAWGNNSYGQLGDGTTSNRAIPVNVLGLGGYGNLSGVSQIAAGGHHSLAIKDGSVLAWGDNEFGQLGDNTTTKRSTPVLVSGLSNVTQIAAGYDHSVALSNDGTVDTWGSTGIPEWGPHCGWFCGPPPLVSPWSKIPVTVSGLLDVARIGAGGYHSLAILNDGSAKSWGDNTYFQLGAGSTETTETSPLSVIANTASMIALSDISQIAAGFDFTLALKSDGSRIYAWGGNYYGQLGDGTLTSSLTPVEVLSEDSTDYLSGVHGIAAGGYHALALLNDGTVRAWGSNTCGQLGNGSTDSSALPVKVFGLLNVTQIVAGDNFSLALVDDGLKTMVRSWGLNVNGQLGNGTNESSSTPVDVVGLSGQRVLQIAAGASHSLALMEDSTMKAWGLNYSGQLGNHSRIDSSVPVDVLDGNGDKLSGVSRIGAGYYDSLAFVNNETILAWGYINGSTQTKLLNVAAMGEGWGDVLILLTGGTARMLSAPKSDLPGLNPGVLGIAEGADHFAALLKNGTVKTWGANYSGQLGNNSLVGSTDPVTVSIFSHAPFVIDNGGKFTAQDSTVLYSGSYGFGGRVTVTEIADVAYNNLELRYTLDNYIFQSDPSRAAKTPTVQDLYDMIMPGGNLTLLGEHKTLPKIDLSAVQGELAQRDISARAFEAMMQSHMGDRSLALDFFSQFFSSGRASGFTTDVRVQEGAVYTLDGVNDMSLLTQGESLRVAFKEKKEELVRMEQKAPEAKPLQPVFEPVVVAGDHQVSKEEFLFGQSKPATPVVMENDETAGRYGTLKNPGKDVFVKCAGGEWQAAKDGMVIMPGDVVKTASSGSVEVMLDGGKVGRVDVKAGSLFRINKAGTNPATGDKTTLLELAVGKLIAHVEKLQGNSKFEVRTPTALTGVRGTVFEVTVKANRAV